MARRKIALACSSVLLFGMAAALVWTGIASADEPTSYAGGTGEFQVAGATTGDDGEWVYVGEFKNDSGVPINDIVVGPKSGDGNGENPPDITGIEVQNHEGGDWGENESVDYDDNNNNEIDEGEDDTTGGPHNTARAIGAASSGTVAAEGETFRLRVRVKTSETTTFVWQATGDGESGGKGGDRIGTKRQLDTQNSSWTEYNTNQLPVSSIWMGGMNAQSGKRIDSFEVDAGTGVTISDVRSTKPGTWNSTTGVFTFNDSVPHGADVFVVVDYAPSGTATSDITCTASFVD